MPEKEPQESTAQEIFDLLKESNLKAKQGHIEITLAGFPVRIKGKNAVGDLLEEWFGMWLKKQDIFFRPKTNNQKSPDFLLHHTSDQEGLLEFKVFNVARKSPNAARKSSGFDIANFDAYVDSLRTQAYRLNADYLIFGYTFEEGVLEIKDFWLKKVWQISGASSKRPIALQAKRGVFYNLRPIKWFAKTKKATPPFASRLEFLTAIRDTLAQRDGATYGETWFHEVSQNYESYYQTSIDSP
jgi:NgoBV restriction endonuclease